MRYLLIAMVIVFISGCGNSAESGLYTKEDLKQALEDGYEEGYESGYNDAVNEEIPAMKMNVSTSSPKGLNLFSDGHEWRISTNYDKKDFVKAVAYANGEFLSFAQVDDWVLAIDIYYENGFSFKTLNEALRDIGGSY